MTHQLLLLPGDGIGPDIVAEARKVLGALRQNHGLEAVWEEAPVGGSAYDAHGDPLPQATLDRARAADAVVLGAVGGPQWEALDYSVRPERALLGLRKELALFANLRPARVFPELVAASPLPSGTVAGIDIMVVRELTGGIYFGEPRGVEGLPDGRRRGVNTLVYTSDEVERIGRVAFDIARKRDSRLCSVDKANVLEATELWREVMSELGERDYPDVALTHMYVDNAAMQLVRDPGQFDVVVTTNMFGDILSDEASMLTGSIGLLPSASLNSEGAGMYEPIHGSAPDIAGTGWANPLATILSVAMMLRYSLDEPGLADRVDKAVERVLAEGLRTPDIAGSEPAVSTPEMGDAVVAALAASESRASG